MLEVGGKVGRRWLETVGAPTHAGGAALLKREAALRLRTIWIAVTNSGYPYRSRSHGRLQGLRTELPQRRRNPSGHRRVQALITPPRLRTTLTDPIHHAQYPSGPIISTMPGEPSPSSLPPRTRVAPYSKTDDDYTRMDDYSSGEDEKPLSNKKKNSSTPRRHLSCEGCRIKSESASVLFDGGLGSRRSAAVPKLC